VSKKFFSLIHGGDIHIAPEAKAIPADEFQKLLDAESIIDKVKEDATQYRKEVAADCEKLKEQAQKEGYEAGFKEWIEHIGKMQHEIEEVRTEYAKMLAPVALKATQKIVGKAFELSEDLIFNVVTNSLKPVLQHKRITIYVNKNDLDNLERNRDNMKKLFENIELLSIREREDISQGGCVIETEGGIINVRLENQWGILEKAFDTLFKSESSPKTISDHKHNMHETQK